MTFVSAAVSLNGSEVGWVVGVLHPDARKKEER